MMHDEFRAARKRLGWSRPHLAKRLGVLESSVLHWETGRSIVPERLADWMQAHVTLHDTVSELPEDWDTTSARL